MPTAPPSSDAAVEARVFWLRFQKEIAAALIIVILAIIGFAGYRFYTYRRNSTAAELLGNAKSPQDYQDVITRYPGTPAGASAYPPLAVGSSTNKYISLGNRHLS